MPKSIEKAELPVEGMGPPSTPSRRSACSGCEKNQTLLESEASSHLNARIWPF